MDDEQSDLKCKLKILAGKNTESFVIDDDEPKYCELTYGRYNNETCYEYQKAFEETRDLFVH